MKKSGLEFIIAEQEKRGDTDMRTAKMLGMSQPGYTKAKRSGVAFRIDYFVRYCKAAGYEIAVIPSEQVGILNDSIAIIEE